jgi:hypothetical protein
MANQLWKAITRQRRYWPPDASFVVVIALSIVLGVWPLADPQWSNKSAYLLVVIAMLIVASLVSARDKWRLERRYAADFGAHLIAVRNRVFSAEKRLADIANAHSYALESGSAPPSFDESHFDFSDELMGVFRAVMDRQHKTLMDMRAILEELIVMNARLSELYDKTLPGD